jgi:Ca2+/H+ antiporter, TMEM165/GDT1 family
MAAHDVTPMPVAIGTTPGKLIADVPAVFVGDKLAAKVPLKLFHAIAAAIFALLGLAALPGAGA